MALLISSVQIVAKRCLGQNRCVQNQLYIQKWETTGGRVAHVLTAASIDCRSCATMKELQLSQSADLRRLLLTTCVLKRVHRVSKEIILASRKDALSFAPVDGADTTNRTPLNSLNPSVTPSCDDVTKKGVGTPQPVDDEEDENVQTMMPLSASPPRRKRSRRVTAALRGLAHGLLLRRRSSVEKDEAVQSVKETVFEFSR